MLALCPCILRLVEQGSFRPLNSPAQPLSKDMKLFSKEYLLNSTPSRKDGVDAVKEQQLRKTYSNFIMKMCKELKL